MIRKLHTFGLLVALVLSAFAVEAQVGTPQYTNGYSGTATNVFPFRTTSSNRTQWCYAAGEFSGAYPGFISAIYVQTMATGSSTYTNFTVKLGEMPASFTTFPNGTYLTSNMTTHLSSSSYSMPSHVNGNWYKIPLQSPYMYDPSKTLIIEISNTAYSNGFGTRHDNGTGGTKRIYGNVANSSGTAGTSYGLMGIDIMPASGFDLKMDEIVSPVVLGIGNNTVEVKVRNARVDTIFSFSLGYQLDNNTPIIVTGLTPSTPILTGETYSYTFSTPINIANAGTYTLKAWCYNPNNKGVDDIPTDDTITITTCTGMSGTYTLGGAGAAYPTFASAAQALTTCGVAGPVTFQINPGTYTEKVSIGSIIGASSTNTITFEGTGTASTELTYNGSSTADWTTLLLNGADYCTFKNMTISNYGATYANAVLLSAGADYNNFDSCNIHVTSGTGSYMCPVNISGSTTTYTSGNSGNYNMFTNNDIKGGYYCVRAYGGGSTAIVVGNEFINNDIYDYYYYGMYMYYCGDQVIAYNRISARRTGSYTANAYGIMNYYGRGDIINGNIIKANGYYGIYSYRQNYYYQSGYQSYVCNNMVSDFINTSYQVGLYAYYNYNTNIVNNSFWANGSYGSSYTYAALYAYYPYYCDISNNICITTNGNLAFSLMYPQSTTSDNNLFNYTGSTGYRFCYSGTYYYNFATFQANSSYGAHDQNSLDQADPQLKSMRDLHLLPGAEGYIGKLVSYPDTDVDGDPRCLLQSWIGADEPYHTPQSVDFIAADTICLITPVTFYNTGIESEPHYNEWYLNDNFETNDFNFTHSFTTSGIDTVEFRMLTCSSNDTIIKYVYVEAPTAAPVSEFMAEKNIVEIDEIIELIDISDRCPTSWTWAVTPATVTDPITGLPEASYNLENSTTLNSQNVELSFNYSGDYTVALTTTNGIGAGPTESKVNYINVKFVADMCGMDNENSEPLGNLYDDGGKNGNYAANGFCDYLIRPCADDVKITFVEFSLGTESYLRLYDGATNRGTPIWDTETYPDGITGYIDDAGFDTILTSTASGMVYIEFEKGAQAAKGFKLTWEGVGAGNYLAPIAEFDCADTGCVVNYFQFENISFADPMYSRYTWDYDGDGNLDGYDIHGEYLASFPGIIAQYLTTLTVDNCGGMDTFKKTIFLINPQSKPTGEFFANIESPVRNQDIVTLEFVPERLSCVNTYEWIISPSTFYFENGTDMYSVNPQVVFKTLDSFTVTLKAGNSNTPYSSVLIKEKYIVPKEYCSPIVLNLHQDIGISRVAIEDIDNSSATGIEGYANYSNIASTKLVVDQNYSITVERNSTFNAMERIVWIDLDNDGEFENTEIVAFEDSAHTQAWTGNIYIPTTATLGATIMRVGANYSGYSNNPCGPFQFGEFEDYRIFISPDNTPPVITLIGNATEYVEQGYTYNDPGATAWDNLQGNIDTAIMVSGTVNTAVVGGYFISYNVCDSLGNCAATTKRLVIVTPDNTPPVITLLGGDPFEVNVNVAYVDSSYTAFDLVDGDITDQVVLTHNVDPYVLGEYAVSYYVEDAMGLSDTKSRGVIVKDVAAPTITLDGDAMMYVEIMTPFIDPGVTYSDNYWPQNKISFVKSGLVDTTKIGTYMVNYSVTDASGNGPNKVTRTVIVWDSSAPTVVVNGPDEVVINVNEEWVDPGVNITDNSFSGFVIETQGTFYKYFGNGTEVMMPDSIGLFSIFYKVTDAAGNVSDMIARIVRVVDIKCPVLTLKGDLFVTVEKWDDYDDEGYDVFDNYYPESEITVEMTSTVNVHEPGLYQVAYTATDPSNNNCAMVVRMVRVVYNSVGIDEATEVSMEVYPNPSNGVFNLTVNMPASENVVISVLNLLGEEIMTINDGQLKTEQFVLDLSNQASGVYILKAQTDSRTMIERIVLSK